MSVVRFDFLKVLPADVGEHGGDGACLLALVRYMTALPGEHNGRQLIEREMWWEATYDEIGAALGGVSRQSVGRMVRRLESDKALLSRRLDGFSGDQTKAYRVPEDQPSEKPSTSQCSESNNPKTPATGQCSESNRTGSKSNDPRSKSNNQRFEIEHSSSSTEELNEEDEEGGERDTPPPAISEVVSIHKIARSGGSVGSGRLSGAISSNGVNGRVPALTAPNADLVPANQTDTTTPPPGFCSQHPQGADRPCGPCGDARRHREAWLTTPEGKAWRLREETDTHRIRMQAKTNAREEQLEYTLERATDSGLGGMFGLRDTGLRSHEEWELLSKQRQREEDE